MANNVKLERISLELAKRLNDAVTSAGIVITTGDQDGTVLTAIQRMGYINEAMHALVNEAWQEANKKDWKNAKQIFAGIFPELVVTRSVTTTATSLYVIASPNKDYFQLLEATVNGLHAEFMPSYLYLAVKSGRTLQIKGSTTIPMVVETGGTIYFFPDNSAFQSKTAELTFLRQPLNSGSIGTAGIFLTMDAATSEDSPFYDSWNSAIASRAEKLFREDSKE